MRWAGLPGLTEVAGLKGYVALTVQVGPAALLLDGVSHGAGGLAPIATHFVGGTRGTTTCNPNGHPASVPPDLQWLPKKRLGLPPGRIL